MHELLGLSLTELTRRLHAREASPVELMEAVLQRIDDANPDLNAIVSRRDSELLLEEAREAEARIGRDEGRPLEGIPLGVKDLEDVEGMKTTRGSLLFKDNLATRDSTQVARLRGAGAIVVGKTNTPEFGFTALTKNLVFGVTRSPWDRERTPGGSSGGSAAALVGGLLPLVTASDGGGSIRIPASFTGAFGLKTTYGRIPRGPMETWDSKQTSVYGPLTRTVEDAALFLDQVVGVSADDPASLPAPGYSYREVVNQPLSRALRIAYSPDLGYAVVQSDIAVAVEEAARSFEGLGHSVHEIEGGPPQLGDLWGKLLNYQLGGQLAPFLKEREGDITRALVQGMKTAWDTTPEEMAEGDRRRARLSDWCARLFEDYDLLLTPTLSYDPPPARGPFPTETDGRPQLPTGAASFTIPFNFSWHPAATVRVGLSEMGLPMGMQIVGPRHREDLVLQAARLFERERPWHPHWPAV